MADFAKGLNPCGFESIEKIQYELLTRVSLGEPQNSLLSVGGKIKSVQPKIP